MSDEEDVEEEEYEEPEEEEPEEEEPEEEEPEEEEPEEEPEEEEPEEEEPEEEEPADEPDQVINVINVVNQTVIQQNVIVVNNEYNEYNEHNEFNQYNMAADDDGAAPVDSEQPAAIEPNVDDEEKKQPVFSDEDTHPQPFADARPSIEGAADFDEDTAKAAAEKLRSAMKGFGTNEKKIISVTNSYNHEQRMAIKAAFEAEYERNLLKDFKNELRGSFEKMVIGFWMDPGRYDADLIEDACSGMGTDEDLLREVICTRTNREIELMKAAWNGDKNLIRRVKGEIKGSFEELLVAILEGSRGPNGPPDEDAAQEDAEELNRLLRDDKKEAKAKFVEVFSTRSWVQIRAISAVFQDIAKKYTLTGAIDEAFGDGDTGKALLTINEFSCQPYDYWAKKLKDAMKGMGTNDSLMRRVLVSRAGVDLRDIGITFGNRYGDGKTLAKWIKDDLSGDYEKLCLAVCGLD